MITVMTNNMITSDTCKSMPDNNHGFWLCFLAALLQAKKIAGRA